MSTPAQVGVDTTQRILGKLGHFQKLPTCWERACCRRTNRTNLKQKKWFINTFKPTKVVPKPSKPRKVVLLISRFSTVNLWRLNVNTLTPVRYMRVEWRGSHQVLVTRGVVAAENADQEHPPNFGVPVSASVSITIIVKYIIIFERRLYL